MKRGWVAALLLTLIGLAAIGYGASKVSSSLQGTDTASASTPAPANTGSTQEVANTGTGSTTAAPAQASARSQCTAQGLGEGGGPVPFTVNNLTCAQGEGVVVKALHGCFQDYGSSATRCAVPGTADYTCDVIEGALEPGNHVACTDSSIDEVDFQLQG